MSTTPPAPQTPPPSNATTGSTPDAPAPQPAAAQQMRAGETVSDNSVALPGWRLSLERLRYLAQFIKPYRRMFRVSIITAILATGTATAIPFAFKVAIDRGITKGNLTQLDLWVVVALVLGLLSYIVTTINTYTSIWAVRVLNDLRVALFAHVQRQGLSFFHTMRTGVVISRLTNDVDAIESLVSDGVFMVFINFMTLVFIELYLFFIDWRLALAMNVIFPVMIAATVTFRYYSARAYRRTRERMAQVTAFLAESLAGMRIVQSFAAEGRMAEDFEKTNAHYRKANMDTIYQSSIYFPGVELLSAVGTGVVLWYGGFLFQRNLIEAGVLFAFIVYINDFFDPIQQLSQFYGNFLSAMAALDKIMMVMETQPDVLDNAGAVELSDVRGDVSFNHVSFAYSAGAPEVLHDVDVHVKAGETVALVGHTGAGKSTFVRLLTRFHDPVRGTITLDGHDIRDLQGRWLRRSMGIVPQEGFLFNTTVGENIRFGRPDATDEDVRAAAHNVGAHTFIEALEHGYDTHVGERGMSLSAGQRQLVAFARALLSDPALLVLDEATSSVDVETEQRLADGLRALVAGRTSFVVAHRLTTIRGADRILVVDDGRLVEQGTHDELVNAGGHYGDLFGSWSREASVEECLAPSADAPADAPA